MLYLAIVSLFTTSESGMDPSDVFCILSVSTTSLDVCKQNVSLYTMFPICVEKHYLCTIFNVCKKCGLNSL